MSSKNSFPYLPTKLTSRLLAIDTGSVLKINAVCNFTLRPNPQPFPYVRAASRREATVYTQVEVGIK
ncbi:MAG: hypothetical protein RMZ41_023310 [Nostoc sp. DedVER02]|uniref:hypothetical protein n=1 Tax=unclassified Nostoc TaxID=2593658 RepID=UPI002AD37DEB|nr:MULTISPECIES: hypothetical protein [unclassified Nostoc]MDZ7988141.1 hypothetical protein [Nostoc sp. DedVER02]MDZ8116197.1 hypothetical protein [Nostoc sp. DedVER01b]